MVGQWWNAGFGALHFGGLKPVLGLQLHEAVKHAVGCASAWKGLVRDLGDAPDLAEIAEHAAQISPGFDHPEIAERSLENVFDAGNAAPRQIGRDQRIACIEADLQTEQHGALPMGLHRATELAIDMTEEGRLPISIEAHHVT